MKPTKSEYKYNMIWMMIILVGKYCCNIINPTRLNYVWIKFCCLHVFWPLISIRAKPNYVLNTKSDGKNWKLYGTFSSFSFWVKCCSQISYQAEVIFSWYMEHCFVCFGTSTFSRISAKKGLVLSISRWVIRISK